MELFKTQQQEKEFVSTYSDPFDPSKCNSICFWVRKNWNEETEFFANIRFENGNTEGKHKIEADDFVSLVHSVEMFLKTL